jgi:DNA-binding MarR family transcriptional regulator
MTPDLREELQQRKPFGSVQQEAQLSVIRTGSLLTDAFERMLKPYGITAAQFNVLRILRGAGDEGLPTLEVAERMIEQTPGVTRLLDRLEAKELVRRQRCPRDRRQHLCWISTKGLQLLEKIDALTTRAPEESLKGLRQKDRVTFIRLLDAIRAAHQ